MNASPYHIQTRSKAAQNGPKQNTAPHSHKKVIKKKTQATSTIPSSLLKKMAIMKWNEHRYDPFNAGLASPAFKPILQRKLSKYLKHPTAQNIRVSARMAPKENRWGAGLDEMIQTRLLSNNSNSFGHMELSYLYQQRISTADLVWATEANGHSPLAGHTPALKSHTTRNIQGVISEEHGRRDKLREEAIIQESDYKMQAIKARLATIKYMMSPAEELKAQQTRLNNHLSPIYSIHTKFDDLRQSVELSRFAKHQQTTRETLKWHTAAEMFHNRDLHPLIPPEYWPHFDATHNNKTLDPTAAMKSFQKEHGALFSIPPPANNTLTTQTDDLSRVSLLNMAIGRQRALSSPRVIK